MDHPKTFVFLCMFKSWLLYLFARSDERWDFWDSLSVARGAKNFCVFVHVQILVVVFVCEK